MNILTKLFATTFLICAIAATAQKAAAAKISLFGAANYSLYSETDASTGLEAKGGVGYGGGLLVGFPVSSSMALELGAAYQIMSFTTSGTVFGVPVDVSTSSSGLSVPVTLAIGMGSVALNLGGYYYLSLESGGGSDYGAVAGIRFRTGSWFLEPQFLYGLNGTSGTKLAQLLIGYTFGGKR